MPVIPNELHDRPLTPADESLIIAIIDGDSFFLRRSKLLLTNSQIESLEPYEDGLSRRPTKIGQKTTSGEIMRKETPPRSPRRKLRHRYRGKGLIRHVAMMTMMMVVSIVLSLLPGKASCWCNKPPLSGNSIVRNPTSSNNNNNHRQSAPLSASSSSTTPPSFPSSFFADRDPPYVAIVTEPDACSTDERVESTFRAVEEAVSTGRVDLVSVRPDGDAATASPETLERARVLTDRLMKLSEARRPLRSTTDDDDDTPPSTEDSSMTIQRPSFFYVVCSSDWVDVARRVRAHGIHVKESQLESVPEWKSSFGYDILVGTSTHSVESAVKSSTLYRPHYYFVGTCFPTESHPEKKDDPGLLEGPALPGIVKRSLLPPAVDAYDRCPPDDDVPAVPAVFAIGGIDETNCMVPILAGADGVAVIRSVLQADRPGRAVAAMHRSMMKDTGISERRRPRKETKTKPKPCNNK